MGIRMTPLQVRLAIQQNRTKRQNLLDLIEEVEKELRDIQKNCPHEHETYSGDPSGNNDSSWECSDCRRIR